MKRTSNSDRKEFKKMRKPFKKCATELYIHMILTLETS